MSWFFRHSKKTPAEKNGPAAPRTMADFFAAAGGESNGLTAADAQWFSHLPYKGAMSKDQARQFEVEKRAYVEKGDP